MQIEQTCLIFFFFTYFNYQSAVAMIQIRDTALKYWMILNKFYYYKNE